MARLVKKFPWATGLLGFAVLLLPVLSQLASARSVPYERTLSESIKSDRSVYPLSSPVQLRGRGFAVSIPLTLRITAPDGTSSEFLAVSDSQGKLNFTFNPSLPGGYVATVVGPSGKSLATMSFTSGTTIYPSKVDYRPGEYVTIYGEEWQPGETVSIVFHELVD